MEIVSCAICGGDDTRRLVTRGAQAVVKCRGCGLVYVSPRPPAAAIVSTFELDRFFESQVKAGATEAQQRRERARMALVDKHAGRRGRLLDVGCSAGSFLRAARDAGWQASGIDVSPACIEYCRGQGFDAHVARAHETPFAAASFDAITFFDSLAHMHAPIAALREAVRLLAPGGLMCITSPNVDGLLPRVTYQMLARTVGVWEHPVPTQVYQFSRDTLGAALDKVGMKPVHTETYAIPASFTAGVITGHVIEALKQRGKQPAAGEPTNGVTAEAAPEPQAPPSRGSLARRVFRSAVEGTMWSLATAVSLPARWTDQGDSMLVIARRA